VPGAQKTAEPDVIASKEPRRNLSKEAFDALPVETQDEIREIIPNAGSGADEFSSSVPVQVHALVEFVKSKEEECEKKFWKINIGGKDIVVKDYVKSTLDVLQQIGDIAIQFAPTPGSIVWSGVKTIMQVSDIIQTSLVKVLTIICRCTLMAKRSSVPFSWWLNQSRQFSAAYKLMSRFSPLATPRKLIWTPLTVLQSRYTAIASRFWPIPLGSWQASDGEQDTRCWSLARRLA
jgi:hypothetical protein